VSEHHETYTLTTYFCFGNKSQKKSTKKGECSITLCYVTQKISEEKFIVYGLHKNNKTEQVYANITCIKFYMFCFSQILTQLINLKLHR
jgi:hypothetical protein